MRQSLAESMKLQLCCEKQPLLSRTLLRNPEFIGLFSKRALTFCWAYQSVPTHSLMSCHFVFGEWGTSPTWMERETHTIKTTRIELKSYVTRERFKIRICACIYVWYDVYIALSMLHHVAHKVLLAPKSVLFLTMVWCSAFVWWCDIMCTYASCSACICATWCSIYVQRDVVYMCDMVYVCDMQ